MAVIRPHFNLVAKGAAIHRRALGARQVQAVVSWRRVGDNGALLLPGIKLTGIRKIWRWKADPK